MYARNALSWLALAALLGGSGCLRIGYRQHGAAGSPAPDAGAPDAGALDAATGSSGTPGTGGAAAATSGGSTAAGSDAAGSGGVGGDGASGNGGGGQSGSSGTEAAGSAAAGSGGDGSAAAGGTPDAGTPQDAGTDAASPDSGSGAGPCATHPEALFCDGMEDAALAPPWGYELVKGFGALAQSSAQVHSGSFSVRASTTKANVNNQARLAYDQLGALTSGDVWLRYYNYLPSSVTLTTHFSSGVISSLTGAYEGFWLQVNADRVDIGHWNGTVTGTLAYPRDRWVCVELHVRIDAVSGVFEAYLDGVPAATSPAMNTVPAGGYSSAEIGIHYAESTQGAMEVFVDDAVVSRVRVPCD